MPKFLFKKADIWPFSICAALKTGHLQVAMRLDPENGDERGLGEAVWADFRWKINSKTSPIDLEGFRPDRADPKIQKIACAALVSGDFRRFSGSMSALVGSMREVFWHTLTCLQQSDSKSNVHELCETSLRS